MAKKRAVGQPTIAEATRQTWKELGKGASGVDVAKEVKNKFGHEVPSSTISMAKKTVFGKKGRVKTKGKGKKGASSESGLPVQLKSKTQIVKELMESGLNSPTEISAAARKLGIKITPGHVSMIKGNLKRAGGKKSGGKRRKKVRRGISVVSVAVKATGAASDVALENAALRLALKAGSVQAAMEALGRLE